MLLEKEILRCKYSKLIFHEYQVSCILYHRVIGAGVTLHNALEAAKTLESQGKEIKVVDLFTIKPLNVDWLKQQAASANNRIVVVEDHYAEGGIGEAVSSALNQTDIKIHQLCVERIPRSGPPAALMAMFKIDAAAIVDKVNSL